MLENKIFIASTGNHVVRALHTADNDWMVDCPLKDKQISCLASDPVNQNIIYAGSKTQGVFRSEDFGDSWQQSGLSERCVKSLAVSPLDTRIVYAGTKPALMFASYDSAGSWQELEGFRRIPNRWWWFSPAEPPDLRPYVMAIAVSPSDKNLLLAGIEFGAVVRSEDGGINWSRHCHGALRDCHSLKFHYRDGDRVYQAGGTGGGAALSIDKGISFRKKKTGLQKNYGIVCAADPADPDLWYVCVAPGPFKAYGREQQSYLYRSSGESNWHPAGWLPHPLSTTATALVTDPRAPGHLYAGLTNGTIWHTRDKGDHWQKLPFNMKSIWFSLLLLQK